MVDSPLGNDGFLLEVQTDTSPVTWTDLSIRVRDVQITHGIESSEMEFVVDFASVVDRRDRFVRGFLVRAHIAIDDDDDGTYEHFVRFYGVITQADVEMVGHEEFNLRVICGGGKTWASGIHIFEESYPSGEEWTDIITDLWTTHAASVSRNIPFDSRVVNDTDGYVVRLQNLSDITDEIVRNFLGDKDWYIDVGGGWTLTVRVVARGVRLSGITLDEDDLGIDWTMRSRNPNLRNRFYVQGGTGGGDSEPPGAPDPERPVWNVYEDTVSSAKHGVWVDYRRHAEVEDVDDLLQLATEYARRGAAPYYGLNVGVQRWDFERGEHVTLDITAIGVNGLDFSSDYIAEQTIDSWSRDDPNCERRALLVEQ